MARAIEILRDRWETVSWEGLASRLSRGEASPLGMTGRGYQDFRGVTIDKVLLKLNLERLDLSHSRAILAGCFTLCRVRDCLFMGMAFGLDLAECEFSQCDFTGAYLQEARFIRGRYTECVFGKSRMKGAVGHSPEFVKCVFDGADLRKASYYASTFRDCSFKGCRFGGGSLSESKLFNCALEKGDLGDTIIEMTNLV